MGIGANNERVNTALKVILEKSKKCICEINVNNIKMGTVFFCLIPFPEN